MPDKDEREVLPNIDCVYFLQWALPRLNFRWQGFRKVRRQVCKRLTRRLKELGLDSFRAYREYLLNVPSEWTSLDQMCRITISRFYRDRGVFDALRSDILPNMFKETQTIDIWCIGCASGEEPYTLALILRLAEDIPGDKHWTVLASDVDPHLIERAKDGVYPQACLRELPDNWIPLAFDAATEGFRIKDAYKEGIDFRVQDIRSAVPAGHFNLILCRNLVFTYFDTLLQEEIGLKIASKLHTHGYLIVGSHEHLPPYLSECFKRISSCVYVKR
ncbi:MAG: hypothetical protein OEM26_04155 [Saprospiraceae bacterium]|nr:hypothetical protein [Saprospiraceae bacterium]